MKFIRMEVKNAERLSYINKSFTEHQRENKNNENQKNLPTAAGLFVGQKATCIFCERAHDSQACISAQEMTNDMKKRKILEKGHVFPV